MGSVLFQYLPNLSDAQPLFPGDGCNVLILGLLPLDAVAEGYLLPNRAVGGGKNLRAPLQRVAVLKAFPDAQGGGVAEDQPLSTVYSELPWIEQIS